MKWFFAIILSALLFSCGDDTFTANCGTWGEFTECRELNETELEIYNDVASCMGVVEELPSPTVVIVAGDTLSCGDVNSAGCQIRGFVAFAEPEADVLESEFIWRHEFTHEILELTSGSADRRHRTQWFTGRSCIR